MTQTVKESRNKIYDYVGLACLLIYEMPFFLTTLSVAKITLYRDSDRWISNWAFIKWYWEKRNRDTRRKHSLSATFFHHKSHIHKPETAGVLHVGLSPAVITNDSASCPKTLFTFAINSDHFPSQPEMVFLYEPAALQILRAFSELRKAIISLVMSVHLSVRMEKLVSHWKNFDEIRYLSFFGKYVKKIQVSLKSDRNNDSLY